LRNSRRLIEQVQRIDSRASDIMSPQGCAAPVSNPQNHLVSLPRPQSDMSTRELIA
jgi:hypothetical protein